MNGDGGVVAKVLVLNGRRASLDRVEGIGQVLTSVVVEGRGFERCRRGRLFSRRISLRRMLRSPLLRVRLLHRFRPGRRAGIMIETILLLQAERMRILHAMDLQDAVLSHESEPILGFGVESHTQGATEV